MDLHHAAKAAAGTLQNEPINNPLPEVYYVRGADDTAEQLEILEQSKVIRDIFGNPFRPIALNPAWLTPTVTTLATSAYNECSLPSGELDTIRLAVLADALEEAGCDNAAILGHLRSPGPHVRGCWALDLVLGKE
jgi:hypothetical protein